MALPVSMFGNPPGAVQQARNNARLLGSGRRPDPPTSIVAQPGCNSFIVTWQVPSTSAALNCTTRIYLDVESNLFAQLPPGCNYAQLPATGGPTPQDRAFYLSCVNPSGAESRKVFGKCSAAPQANGGPPPNATGSAPRFADPSRLSEPRWRVQRTFKLLR